MACPRIVQEQVEKLLAADLRVFNLQCQTGSAQGSIVVKRELFMNVNFCYIAGIVSPQSVFDLWDDTLVSEIFGESEYGESLAFVLRLKTLGDLSLTKASHRGKTKYYLIVTLASKPLGKVYLSIQLSSFNCNLGLVEFLFI